jgi:hypothetical protein
MGPPEMILPVFSGSPPQASINAETGVPIRTMRLPEGPNVENHGTHIDGQSTRGHLPVNEGLDQLFLPSLGVLYFQALDLDTRVMFCLCGQMCYGIQFIVFDTDDCFIYIQGFHHDGGPGQYLICLFQYQDMIGCQVRFTFSR